MKNIFKPQLLFVPVFILVILYFVIVMGFILYVIMLNRDTPGMRVLLNSQTTSTYTASSSNPRTENLFPIDDNGNLLYAGKSIPLSFLTSDWQKKGASVKLAEIKDNNLFVFIGIMDSVGAYLARVDLEAGKVEWTEKLMIEHMSPTKLTIKEDLKLEVTFFTNGREEFVHTYDTVLTN